MCEGSDHKRIIVSHHHGKTDRLTGDHSSFLLYTPRILFFKYIFTLLTLFTLIYTYIISIYFFSALFLCTSSTHWSIGRSAFKGHFKHIHNIDCGHFLDSGAGGTDCIYLCQFTAYDKSPTWTSELRAEPHISQRGSNFYIRNIQGEQTHCPDDKKHSYSC